MITTAKEAANALALSLFLMACDSPESSDTQNSHSSVIRYEMAEQSDMVLWNGIAISEDDNIIAVYSKPYSDDIMNIRTDFASSRFTYREEDGITYENTTSISLPKDRRVREWSILNWNCNSDNRGRRLLVRCNNSRGWREYVYSDHLGIEEFDFPCTEFGFCRYKLVSESGIFSDIR